MGCSPGFAERELRSNPASPQCAGRRSHSRGSRRQPLTPAGAALKFMQPHPSRCKNLTSFLLQGTPAMIDLHYWTTPNGHKITMFLEETGLPYKIIPVQDRQGRTVQARVPEDRAEQPHPRDGRPQAEGRRRADLGVRIRRDPALSRREDRQIPLRRSLWPSRRDPVDVLADGRARADGRTEPSFQRSTPRKRSNTPSTAM